MKDKAKKRHRAILWIGLLARTLLVVLSLILVVILFQAGRNRLEMGDYFRLEVIEYHGVKNFNTKAFNVLLLKGFERDLHRLDLDRVRALAEGEVWVKSATVRRRFPSRLDIFINEREPVALAAIDSDLYVVDDEGVILDSFSSHYVELDRPIVKGLRNTARENAGQENAIRMRTYLQLLKELQQDGRQHARKISEVDVDDPSRVAVIPVEDPVPVYLGDRDFLKRFELFLSKQEVYRQLKSRHGLIEYVDVTYDNKIIFHTPARDTAG